MRVYLHLTHLSIHRQIAYRVATLAGLATNFFFGLLRVAVIRRLSAIYRIQDLQVREPNLEDTIRRIYEEKLLA
jgi:ABC-type uncharacterized transport system permease subunit